MSAFDARIRVAEAHIQVVRENDEAPAYEAELVLGVLTILPVEGGVLPVPIGAFRVGLNKETVVALRDKLTDAAEEMSDKPDITIAKDLSGVDRVQEFQQGLR